MAGGANILAITCLQLLFLCQTIGCQGECSYAIYPQEIAYKTDDFSHPADGSCIPYANNSAPNPPGTDTTQYLHCTQPMTITDSNRGTPTYIWGSAIGNLLFVFPATTSFESITIYYNASGPEKGRPKLRIHAVPDSFQVWDEPNETYPSKVFNEVSPGAEEDGVREVPNSSEDIVSFNTSRVLIQKLTETKTYQFFISEVEFNGSTCNSGRATTGPAETTDPTTSTTDTTDQADSSTATTADMQVGSTSGQRSNYEHSHLITTTIVFALGKILLLDMSGQVR